MLRSLHLPLLCFALSPFHRCNPSRIPSSCAIASLSKYPSIAPPRASLLASSSRSRSCGVSGAFRMCSGGSETNPDGNISAAAAAAPSPSFFCNYLGEFVAVIVRNEVKHEKLASFQKRLVEDFVDPGVSLGFDLEDLLVRNPDIRFCQACGSPTKQVIPDGEEKVRSVCTGCGRIHYENPKMVVGCLVEHDNKVLLCRRKIEPSYGLWTLPAGYVEVGESAAEGAIRKTLEEARADVEIISPFAQLDIPRIGQSYIIFRARLKTPNFSPGPESLECALFAIDDIPFHSLAFSSVIVTLKMYIEDIKAGKLKFHYCTINKRPGASPSDLCGFDTDYHLHS